MKNKDQIIEKIQEIEGDIDIMNPHKEDDPNCIIAISVATKQIELLKWVLDE